MYLCEDLGPLGKEAKCCSGKYSYRCSATHHSQKFRENSFKTLDGSITHKHSSQDNTLEMIIHTKAERLCQMLTHHRKRVLQPAAPAYPHKVLDPALFVSLNSACEMRSFAPISANTSVVFLTSSSDCFLLIMPHRLHKDLFVNGTFSNDPKKLPTVLYTFARLTLFCRKCFIRSLLYT